MTVPRICVVCGAPLAPGAAHCPACLLGLGFGPDLKPDPDPDADPDLDADSVPGPGSGAAAEVSSKFGAFSEVPVPRRFGDYELFEEIGRGGMGVVYRARQVPLDRIVAVKLLLAGPLVSPESLRRFEREARSAARLHHPNIVAIHEFGTDHGQGYLSMDFVPGSSLAEAIRQQPLRPVQAARYLRAIAQAVEYAHARGILHRDLKPSNILIDAEDQPRLTDFGLAKRFDEQRDLTLTGQPLGSPNYMAPEQASGRLDALGPASDIYALGAILYHLLTGRPPFLAATIPATLRQVVDAEPMPPRLLDSTLPRDLETLALKCLEKQPARRFASAGELADELGRFLAHEPIRSRPVGPWNKARRWCQRKPQLAAASGSLVALALVLAVGGPVALIRIDHERRAAVRFGESAVRHEQRARETLRRLELLRVRERLDADAVQDGLAILASLVRADPSDRAAATWLLAELTHRSFTLPVREPFVHGDAIHSAEVSRDGRRLLTASRDNSARLWDLATGKPIGNPLAHSADLVQPGEYLSGLHPVVAAFSPDGSRAVTASLDGTARLWNSTNGEPSTGVLAHPSGVTCVGFTPDGQRLASGCKDGSVRFWKVHDGAPVGPVLRHDDWVNVVAFSPDGSLLLTASDDATARVWRMPGGEATGTLIQHAFAVRDACFSPDGTRVATASSDQTAGIWDVATGKPLVPPLRQPWLSPNSVAFSPDGLRLVIASADRTARIWDATTGQPIGSALSHRGVVRTARFSPDGQRIVTASQDRTARVWDARTARPLTERIPHLGAVWSAAFTPDGTRVVTASSDRTAVIWDVRPGDALGAVIPENRVVFGATWSRDGRWILARTRARAMVYDAVTGLPLNYRGLHHHAEIEASEFSPDDARIVTAAADGTIQIWNSRTSEPMAAPAGHAGRIHSARFSPDGRRVVTASADGTACVWDADTGAATSPRFRHGATVYHAEFDPEGSHLITASADHKARVFELSSGRVVVGPLERSEEVTFACFSPDGTRLLTVSRDGVAQVWSRADGRPLGLPLRHDQPIHAARFSPDGQRVLTASRDRTARLWDASSGLPVTRPLLHGGEVLTAAFSPDGQRVVSGSDDGAVSLWDAATGQPIGGPFRLDLAVKDVGFRPDGRWIVAASSDRFVRTWEVPIAPPEAPDWLADLAEAVVGTRRTDREEPEAVSPSELHRRLRGLAGMAGESSGAHWPRWFMADRRQRRASPSAERNVDFWIAQQSYRSHFSESAATLEGVRQAARYAPNDLGVMQAMARLTARENPQRNPHALAEAEWAVRRALALDAEAPEAWWARAAVLESAGRFDEAVAALQEGLRLGPDNLYLWQDWPRLLTRIGREEEADAAFAQAIEGVRRSGLDWRVAAEASLRLDWARLVARWKPEPEGRDRSREILRIPRRSSDTPLECLDLTAAYNAGCRQSWGTGGFGEDLTSLPSGRQQVADVDFDLRGVVQLAGQPPDRDGTGFPGRIDGIPVERRARRLHLLHGTIGVAGAGQDIAAWVVHDGLGRTSEIPVVYGRDVLTWDLPPPRTAGATNEALPQPAWTGPGNLYPVLHLYRTTWTHPSPDVPISSLDFVSRRTGSAPFLVAVTVEP